MAFAKILKKPAFMRLDNQITHANVNYVMMDMARGSEVSRKHSFKSNRKTVRNDQGNL